jgi:hypothetical protein
MNNLRGVNMYINDSLIFELNLENAEFEGNIYIDAKTVIKKIYLKGAKYKYFFTDNLDLAIAAKLSKEGIIVTCPSKEY